MAVKLNKRTRHLAVMALAISALTLPGVATANPENGGNGGWRARSEDGGRQPAADDNGGRRDRQDQREQSRAAPQEQTRAAPHEQPRAAPPPRPQQTGWSGNGGGNGWGGGHRDRSADQSDQRRGRNAGNDAPQAARPEPQQQPAQPGWAGRQDRTATRDAARATNGEGGRNWTEANRQPRDSGAHHQRDDHRRDERQRDRNGGYTSNGNYYANTSDADHRAHDRDHRRWDRQWRSNTSYNWYSYRNSHPSYYRLGTYYSPYRNYSYRRLSIGFFLNQLFFGQNYWIEDPRNYRLPDVYGPYRWVRYYDDAVLVDIYSGEVVDVINNFFW